MFPQSNMAGGAGNPKQPEKLSDCIPKEVIYEKCI